MKINTEVTKVRTFTLTEDEIRGLVNAFGITNHDDRRYCGKHYSVMSESSARRVWNDIDSILAGEGL